MSERIVKETITVERKKLEEIKAFISQYGAARQLLDAILKPASLMTKADWQRVLDEGFYVRTFGDYPKIKLLPPICATLDGEEVAETYEVAREKGLRQPHFKGHPHPEDKVLVAVTTISNRHAPERRYAYNVDWELVTEYIVL